ncbi:MAG: DUF427 domain-containing protein [Chloroflexota bacterium]|nr:DUF427 domain-containing protein [Chloroflexota bacterium]
MQIVSIKDRTTGTTIAEGLLGQDVYELEDSWYFPVEQVEMITLNVTERIYTCPYKGVCYWIDLETDGMHAQNIAWVYEKPKRGYERIAGHIGFSKHGTIALAAELA